AEWRVPRTGRRGRFDLGSALGELARELVVQMREPGRVARRKQDLLAVVTRPRKARRRRAACVEDRLRPDLYGAVPRLAIDRRARGVLHERQDTVERHGVLQLREAELLVRIAVEQHLRVAPNVVERVGGDAGDPPGDERVLEPGTTDRPRRPDL